MEAADRGTVSTWFLKSQVYSWDTSPFTPVFTPVFKPVFKPVSVTRVQAACVLLLPTALSGTIYTYIYTTKDMWSIVFTLVFSAVHMWSDRPKMHFKSRAKDEVRVRQGDIISWGQVGGRRDRGNWLTAPGRLSAVSAWATLWWVMLLCYRSPVFNAWLAQG